MKWFFCWLFNIVSDEARNIADLGIMLATDNEAEKFVVPADYNKRGKMNDSLVVQQKTGAITVRALSSAGRSSSAIQIIAPTITLEMNEAARYLRRKGYVTAVMTEAEYDASTIATSAPGKSRF